MYFFVENLGLYMTCTLLLGFMHVSVLRSPIVKLCIFIYVELYVMVIMVVGILMRIYILAVRFGMDG